MNDDGLRTAHLFAGAGGGLLADLILGHEPVLAAEPLFINGHRVFRYYQNVFTVDQPQPPVKK